LSPALQAREGFVFTEYSVPVLRRMAAVLPQAIALADGAVVGYCLALPPALREAVPELAPMFTQFERCRYHQRPLTDIRFFVGGQVCVDRPWRGRGLLARLYQQIRQSSPEEYELCVTEIATRNQVSVRSHLRLGFEPISTYADAREQWLVVAWPLHDSPAAIAGTSPN
jgi:GNAT superfamily N-acetyltransferase